MANYDPEAYWNQKAIAAQGNHLAAVCTGDPRRDACIDRIQTALLQWGLHRSRHNQPRRKVLDFGCGTGRFYEPLTQHGAMYFGTDLAQAMVDLAQQRHPSGNFTKFDGRTLPYADGEFDLVCCFAVLHHNPYPQQEALMRELARVVRPRGTVLSLEGISNDPPSPEGPFFYRTASGWSAAWQALGLEWAQQRAVRYGTLEGLWHAAWQKVMPASWGARRDTCLHRTWLACDVWLDPYLATPWPTRFHDRLLQVLRRNGN